MTYYDYFLKITGQYKNGGRFDINLVYSAEKPITSENANAVRQLVKLRVIEDASIKNIDTVFIEDITFLHKRKA